MISDIGYRHLDYIKYMRNWASAAHPNQVKLTGLQLVGWLETCIREVINLPNSVITIEIRRLLKNLREKPLGVSEIQALTSIREALVNWLVKTDYFLPRGVIIKKEEDVLVLENPGRVGH